MWKGVIVEESLEKPDLLDLVNVVLRKPAYLEEEKGRGRFHFDKIEVSNINLDKVLKIAKETLKKGFYFHLCKGDVMIVVFKHMSFEHKKGHNPSLDQIRRYGKSMGINEAQLPDDRLIEDPWS